MNKEIKLHTIAEYNGKEYELENLLNDLLYRIDLLEIRINKAIEYIKEHQRKDEFLNLNEWQTRDLLNILRGNDDSKRNV